jgi:hypothetical protein
MEDIGIKKTLESFLREEMNTDLAMYQKGKVDDAYILDKICRYESITYQYGYNLQIHNFIECYKSLRIKKNE